LRREALLRRREASLRRAAGWKEEAPDSLLLTAQRALETRQSVRSLKALLRREEGSPQGDLLCARAKGGST
jgi:hypothetical protein